MLSFTLQAQDAVKNYELYGSDAQKIVPGAVMVKVNPNSSVPSLVLLQEKSQIPFSQFSEWFKTTYKLGTAYQFLLIAENTDDLGNTHYRYSINYFDIAVDQNWLNIHAKNGLVYQFNGNVELVESINTSPGLSEEVALTSALQIVGAPVYLWQLENEEQMLKWRTSDPNATYYPNGILVITKDPTSTADRHILAWQFDVRTSDPSKDQRIFIDASSGQKIKSYPLSFECNTGTVNSTWYGTKNINTDINGDGKYILLDDCGGAQIRTTQTTGADFVADDNSWTLAGETGPGTTHLHGRITMDYFSSIHGRNSYDDAGGNLEIRYINDANAYSSGSGLIRVGNSNSALDANHYNTLDVVAHEFTHSIINNTSALVYQDEPGALNESFSDIFGETTEMWYEALPSASWDWLHREDYFNGNNRSFINPNDKGDPDTYFGTNWAPLGGGDAGGVHTNSGVQNYWFYLLTVGGTGTNDNGDDFSVSGIGIVKARTISWDNLTVQLGVNSDFSDARAGAIAAAVARYGACSNEVKQVTNAWYAVGVGDPYVDVEVASFTNVSCNGGSNGSINISVVGTAPFSYVWSDGPTTKNRTGLASGNYNVVVTDATGCTATISKFISQPTLVGVNAFVSSNYNGRDVSCFGASNGEATAQGTGGTPGYTYLWDANAGNQATAIATNLGAGTYWVTVTDANGCTAMNSVTLVDPPVLNGSITDESNYNGYNISCNGGSDGWAEVTPSGGTPPYTYLWNDGAAQTTAKAENLAAGPYSVQIKDANNCIKLVPIFVNEPPLLTASITSVSNYNGFNISCNGGNDGWAEVTAGGGVAPYTYSWDDGNGQTTAKAEDLFAGTYTVTVTDANGCTAIDNITLTEPTPLTIEAGPNQTVYYGYAPAECATIAWSGEGGGVAPYTITWSDNGAQSHQVCPGNTSTKYTVTITDANGCVATDEVSICVIDVRCGKKLDKVEICHVPEDNPLNTQTLCVSANAVATHLAHGDMLAACGTDHTCYDLAKTTPMASNTVVESSLIAYPNPFSDVTTIEFKTATEGRVSIKVYDNIGKLVTVLVDKDIEAGVTHSFRLSSTNLAPGLNIVVMAHEDGSFETLKLIRTR